MDYSLTDQAESLREDLRRRVREHLPATWMSPFVQDDDAFGLSQAFTRVLAKDGLLTMAWPSEFGGRDASAEEQMVVREEMWASYEPRGSQYMGLNWSGPAIMEFGTDKQKSHWLPQVAEGGLNWCQGFSEPEAGSDLASLRTTAKTVDGEPGWVVNGQKIWTSYAGTADVCILAARTGAQEDRHHGISLFIVPMDREGIEVRGIESILGPHHINEVFFTDLKLEPGDLLGRVDGGWEIIRYILSYERVGIARYARVDRLLNELRSELNEVWVEVPLVARVRFARALVHSRVAQLLARGVLRDQSKNQVRDADAAIARLLITQLDQEAGDVLMECSGEDALEAQGSPFAPIAGAVEDFWRYSRASTIASGTSEVLKIIIDRETRGAHHG